MSINFSWETNKIISLPFPIVSVWELLHYETVESKTGGFDITVVLAYDKVNLSIRMQASSKEPKDNESAEKFLPWKKGPSNYSRRLVQNLPVVCNCKGATIGLEIKGKVGGCSFKSQRQLVSHNIIICRVGGLPVFRVGEND